MKRLCLISLPYGEGDAARRNVGRLGEGRYWYTYTWASKERPSQSAASLSPKGRGMKIEPHEGGVLAGCRGFNRQVITELHR